LFVIIIIIFIAYRYGDESNGFGKCFTDILDLTDIFADGYQHYHYHHHYHYHYYRYHHYQGKPTLMMFIVGTHNNEDFIKGLSTSSLLSMLSLLSSSSSL
jgi:hypothetical protein